MDELKVNRRLELQILAGPFQGTYVTRIEQVEPDRFHVASPTAGGVLIRLQPGARVRCRLPVSSGCYEAETTVLGQDDRTVPITILAMPSSWERVQRRDFVRLDVRVPVRYRPAAPDGGRDGDPGPKPLSTWTRDLSGGGAAILLPEPLPPGTALELWLVLPSGQVIYTLGELVRSGQREQTGLYLTGVRFTGLAETDRDAIIRFIFREQRERRRKGLL